MNRPGLIFSPLQTLDEIGYRVYIDTKTSVDESLGLILHKHVSGLRSWERVWVIKLPDGEETVCESFDCAVDTITTDGCLFLLEQLQHKSDTFEKRAQIELFLELSRGVIRTEDEE